MIQQAGLSVRDAMRSKNVGTIQQLQLEGSSHSNAELIALMVEHPI